MDTDAARDRATQKLKELEDEIDAGPLTLLAPEQPREYDWCWLFPFNTVQGVQSGAFMDSLATGPLVVPKNGAEPWVAPSAPPLERWLNEYAAREGLPEVPLPNHPNPFT